MTAIVVPSPSHRVWWGVSVNEQDPAAYGRFLGIVQPAVTPQVVSLFVKLDSGSTAARLQAVVGRGQTPFVTLETWKVGTPPGTINDPGLSLRAITAGAWDQLLAKQAATIAATGVLTYVRTMHEFNGHWFPWSVGQNGNTPQDYADAWRHIHTMFDQAGASNVRWVWTPNVVQQTHGDVPLGPCYPGDGWVDFVGVTGYARTDRETPTVTFERTMKALRAVTTRPVILSEVGASGPTKVAWLGQFGTWLNQHDRVEGFVYYDTSPSTTGATGSYRIDTKAEASALRSTVAHAVLVEPAAAATPVTAGR